LNQLLNDSIARFFMSIRQITIIGTGLIGGSVGLALKKSGFAGRIVGCDREQVLEQALKKRTVDSAQSDPIAAARGSQIVLLATPVGAIIELIGGLGPVLPPEVLLTDIGGTKTEIMAQAAKVFRESVGQRFLGGHPMAGKEYSGVEMADPELFQDATWFVTPSVGQALDQGLIGEFLGWVAKIGADIQSIDAAQHDRLCGWISHLPQMISTGLAATLVEEFGEDASLLEAGGRALREMTRISASPYGIWRDVVLTNKKNVGEALLKLEQKLAHIRENLDTRGLEEEFEGAHRLRKVSPRRHEVTEK
jgi:prephenate dehydrogenase